MLSHGNIRANVESAYAVIKEVGLGNDVFLSFLPLSHAYEHTAGLFMPISLGAEIYYAEGIDTLSTKPHRGQAHHHDLRAAPLRGDAPNAS